MFEDNTYYNNNKYNTDTTLATEASITIDKDLQGAFSVGIFFALKICIHTTIRYFYFCLYVFIIIAINRLAIKLHF